MFTRTLSIALMAAVALVLATTCPLYAELTKVVHADINNSCDTLLIPTVVDEIGDLLIFPPGERLEAVATLVTLPACPPSNDTGILDARVSITNLTGRDLKDVWYVANRETFISNVDGVANDSAFALSPLLQSFRIDTIGVHRALVAESGVSNNIWEAGETWDFVLQDYSNSLGITADKIDSIGVGDASMALAGVTGSSGSIIALPIPEPTSALLALLGCVGMTFLSRRRGAVPQVTRGTS